MRVSSRGDYACRALVSMSMRAPSERPVPVKEIAERTGLPQAYLEQIFLSLKGAGLVRSKRGIGGGYFLSRTPQEISLADVIMAVDGPITLGHFGEPHADGACDHEGKCVLLSIWDDLGAVMKRELSRYTLADIASMAAGDKPWQL